MGRQARPLNLSDEERDILKHYTRRRKIGHHLAMRAHSSVKELEAAIYEFLDAHNEEPSPFKWTKTADDILANVARFCCRTIVAHREEK